MASRLQNLIDGTARFIKKGSKRLAGVIKARSKRRNRLLRKASFPKRLTLWKNERIKIVFAEQLDYAKIELKLNNPALQVYHDKTLIRRPVFKFDFPKDSYTQVFELKLTELESNSDQPVSLICSDLKGQVLPHKGVSIKLRCRTKFPSSPIGILHLLPWAIEQLRYAPWYVKYPSIVVGLLLCSIIAPALFPDRAQKASEKMEIVLIAANIYPKPIEQWDENFDLTPQGIWRKEDEWDYPAGKWGVIKEKTEDEDPGGQTADPSGIFQINGSGLAVRKIPNSEAFYDFALEFIVRFLNESEGKVGWIVRANKDKQEWYSFELVKNGKIFQFKGFIHSSSGDVPLEGSDEQFEVPECCRQGDQFKIEGVIKGYEFTHCVTLENPDEIDPPRPTLGDCNPTRGRAFKAERNWFRSRYRYGSFGLRSDSEKDKVQILYWHISQSNNLSRSLDITL
jgi:hypothetical protein